MVVGHIGVRKGSKGLPGKNFREIAGKPLIDWSLEQLFRNPKVDIVIVSTDDKNIYDHCLAKGVFDIGLRDTQLATDTASKWDVWQDSLNKISQFHSTIDAFLDLDCTSPLRCDEDIDGALALFFEERPDMVMSCCDARKNPYFNLVELDEKGGLQLSKKSPNHVVARQGAPVVYEHAASTYVLCPEYLKRASFIYDGRVIPYLMPYERCLDIDSPFDFQMVEILMRSREV